ncbi:MAG TPA: ABC transporter permease [Vicinamibacterales bacterium]|nr:ABC transporter permease [Vicinamibacterales bacterium]
MKSLPDSWVNRNPLGADLRAAVRSLLRARGFATAAVLTFALGVTINVAVFSVVDRLMFRPLPYAYPDQLVQLHQSVTPPMDTAPASPVILGEVSLAIAQRTKAFSGVAWAEGFPVATSPVAGQPPLILSVATSNILDVLGVRPVLGRGFVSDDAVSATRSVVLTYEAWQRQFGGSKDVLGATWGIGTGAYQVVGVLPPGFLLPSARFMERCDGLYSRSGVWVNAIPGAMSVGAVARLRPGVSIAAAEAEIAALMGSFDQWGSTRLPEAIQATGRRVVVQPLRSGISMVVRPYLWLLVGGAWVLLGVACVNLSTLLLARGRSREREAAVRTSLGASPSRLIRGAVLEALVLCGLGGAVGVMVCAWIAPVVLAIAPPEFRGFAETPLDGRVLAITVTVAVAAAMSSALGPAITAVRLDVIRILQGAGRDRATSRLRGGAALLTVEAALGAALVVGAAVAIPGFLSLVYRSPGYQPRDLYTVDVPHGSDASDRSLPSVELAARPARVRTVLETLRGLPRVERAAAQLTSFGYGNRDLWRVQGSQTDAIAVSDGWFETVGAALRAGRLLTNDDINEAAQTAVLNEAGVHLLWPQLSAASAVGRRVLTATGEREIVGVVEDIHVKPGTAAAPTMYVPITAASARLRPGTELTAIVRMASGARPDALVIEARLNERFSRHQVTVESVETAIEPVFRKPRLLAALFGSVGSIALVLSGLGLYAVASFEMLRRQYEMGVRLALGGTRGDIVLRMLLVTLRPVAVGTALGLSATGWITAMGEALTIGMSAHTSLPYVTAGFLMLFVAVLATSGPAIRTSRLDAGAVLRES